MNPETLKLIVGAASGVITSRILALFPQFALLQKEQKEFLSALLTGALGGILAFLLPWAGVIPMPTEPVQWTTLIIKGILAAFSGGELAHRVAKLIKKNGNELSQ